MEKEIAINSTKCMDVARTVIIHGVTEKGVHSHIVSWFQTLPDTSITLISFPVVFDWKNLTSTD